MSYVQAGCQKCGQQFNLPLDEQGEPIWTHVCPKTTDERIDELTGLVKKLERQAEISEARQVEVAEANRLLAAEVRASREAAQLAQQYADINRAKDRQAAIDEQQREKQEESK